MKINSRKGLGIMPESFFLFKRLEALKEKFNEIKRINDISKKYKGKHSI